ncbi:MAG: type II toxin-antitoxin system VapC family toxin [Terriglobia bacterium]|jgi:predicted nucleic acid-binding protein
MGNPPAPPLLILDTSVVLKWFLEKDEPDVARARKLREAFLSRRCTLGAPDLLLVEVANALTAGHRSSPEEVSEAIETILKIGLHLFELQFPTLVKAIGLASTHRVTVYDSCFLAVAIASDGLLVTADEAFLRKVGAHVNITSLRNLRLPD